MGTFDGLRSSTLWLSISRLYPFGANWPHAAENMLAYVVVTLNDALLDLVDVRQHPRLMLSKHRQPKNGRLLTITLPDKKKRVSLTLGHNTLVIGDDQFVILNGEQGLMNLVNAIVSEIESFWATGS